MARKPETRFAEKVHDHVATYDSDIFVEKTNNPYRRGIPDFYYDSPGADAWMEFKWFDRLPPVLDLCNTEKKAPPLSVLQQKWLNRAQANGRNVGVVVGCKFNDQFHGVILLDGSWSSPWPRDYLLKQEEVKPVKTMAEELARIIRNGKLA